MTDQEETIENNKKSLKYLILGVIKPELKAALNFKAIKSAHVIADKRKDTIKSSGIGIDELTGIEKEADAPNVLALSANKNYEDIFIGMFVDQIEDFKELHEADLKFQFLEEKDGNGNTIKKHVNTCIKFVHKDGSFKKQNFRSEF